VKDGMILIISMKIWVNHLQINSIERLDVNGNYEKFKDTGELQCVWATSKEQHRNRRDNNNITAFGKTQCMTAWAEEYNLPVSTLKNRLYRAKMKPEDALIKQRGV